LFFKVESGAAAYVVVKERLYHSNNTTNNKGTVYVCCVRLTVNRRKNPSLPKTVGGRGDAPAPSGTVVPGPLAEAMQVLEQVNVCVKILRKIEDHRNRKNMTITKMKLCSSILNQFFKSIRPNLQL